MKNKFTKITTGFDFLDKNWGGVYPGGNYLVFGPKRSGKTLLTLKILEYLANRNSGCFFITDERKKSLEIQAASLYFDIDEFISQGFVKVERLKNKTVDFKNIIELIDSIKPSFVFIDEITKFIKVTNPKDFGNAYINFLEYLEENDITSFFNASSVKIKDAKLIINTVAKNSVGIIQISPDTTAQKYTGNVTLKPNIGHIEGEFTASYKIEPITGFTIEEKMDLPAIINKGVDNGAISKIINMEGFTYSNIYNIEDFKLILESQKSYVNNTGKKINIIEYEIFNDKIGTETLSEVIKKTLSRGDKISIAGNKIFILLSEKSSAKIKKILSKLDNIIQLEFNKVENLDETLLRRTHLLKENFKID